MANGYELGTAKTLQSANQETASSPVVWRYGSGIAGSDDGQLSHPMTAEEIDGGDSILIAEERNGSVIIVDKRTKEITDAYGDRGEDSLSFVPESATLDPNGDIIIPDYGGDRVIIVDRDSHSVTWSYSVTSPRCAILWDDSTIAISRSNSDASDEVRWVDISTQTTVKAYQVNNSPNGSLVGPNGLWKIDGQQATSGNDSIMVGYDQPGIIEEVDYTDLSVTWSYGEEAVWEHGHAYNRARGANYGLRLGGLNSHSTTENGLNIINDNEMGHTKVVNGNGELLWIYGGINYERGIGNAQNMALTAPHGLRLTKDQTILMCDSHGHRVYEVDPLIPPAMPEYMEGWLAGSYDTTDSPQLINIGEFRHYSRVIIEIENRDQTNDAAIEVRPCFSSNWSADTINNYANNISAASKKRYVFGGSASFADVNEEFCPPFIALRASSAVSGSPANIRAKYYAEK